MRTPRDRAERYLVFVRRRGEDGALRKVGAIRADLREWRRDPDFRDRERATITGERGLRPRVVNPWEVLGINADGSPAERYVNEHYDRDQLGIVQRPVEPKRSGLFGRLR